MSQFKQMTTHPLESEHPLAVVRYAKSTVTVSIDWQQVLPECWHAPSFEHDLVRKVDSDKKTWSCQICGKNWASKPKTRCLGIPPVANLRHTKDDQLLTLQIAASENLKLKSNSVPSRYYGFNGCVQSVFTVAVPSGQL